jgi:hypothetical protein
MSPSDLIMSNVYTDFLFHRNLITDRTERMKLDIMFKNAFKDIESQRTDRIRISAQDDHGDILPIMDPLDYLDQKKQSYRDIEIEDPRADGEEGFKRGELIPMAYDRDEAEEKRVRFEEQIKMEEFPDINIGIPEEEKQREEAKQAKVRELQEGDKPQDGKIPESTLEEKLESINRIKIFNRKVEEAMLKRDNLLKLVSKENKPKTLEHFTGEREYEDYNVDGIQEAYERAKEEQELKNLKDYEAIRILQKVLPESVGQSEDLPNAVAHFLNNPFEFLVYENPQAIPEDVRKKVISDNKNLLMNDEKYIR